MGIALKHYFDFFLILTCLLNTQGYTKSFLITITYLLFVAIPYVVHMNLTCSRTTITIRVWLITMGLNNIAHVFIYVLSDHKIREYLNKVFKWRSTNTVDGTTNADYTN